MGFQKALDHTPHVRKTKTMIILPVSSTDTTNISLMRGMRGNVAISLSTLQNSVCFSQLSAAYVSSQLMAPKAVAIDIICC